MCVNEKAVGIMANAEMIGLMVVVFFILGVLLHLLNQL